MLRQYAGHGGVPGMRGQVKGGQLLRASLHVAPGPLLQQELTDGRTVLLSCEVEGSEPGTLEGGREG